MGKNTIGNGIFSFKTLSICKNLMEAITCKEITEGCVHSVFENACNIDTDQGLVTLLNADKEMSPMSIKIDNVKRIDFRNTGLGRYSQFRFDADGIFCRSGNIYINLTSACLWSPPIPMLPRGYARREIGANLELLEYLIPVYCKYDGMGMLAGELCAGMPELGLVITCSDHSGVKLEFIKSRFFEFMRALSVGNTNEAVKMARGIIGFGPGLTPSMDDFICGMMVSFVYLGKCFGLNMGRIVGFNRSLAAAGSGRTTRVSEEMLKHAAEGETNQALSMLMCAVIDDHEVKSLTDALVRTVKIGETSGSDMVFGLYVGCRLMSNSELRGEWLDESVC